jgi:hypothetical protein
VNPLNYLIAAGLGALLGVAELLSRYRDNPVRIGRRGASWAYLAVNAAASAFALLLIDRFGWDFGQAGDGLRTTQVLMAGLGSAILFRSSLFIFKVGDENVGMGPSLVLTSLLGAADRAVDRDQASERLRSAGQVAQRMSFAKAKDSLVATCLAATANVSAEDAAQLRTAVQALESSPMSDKEKSLVLGMLIIDTVGAQVLTNAVTQLGDEIV